MAPTYAVLKAKHYLHVILDPETPARQAKCLLGTANKDQLRAITEIFNNILSINRNLLFQKPKLKRALSRYSDIVLTLGRVDTSYKQKLTVIREQPQVVLSLIIVIRESILKTLKNNEISR